MERAAEGARVEFGLVVRATGSVGAVVPVRGAGMEGCRGPSAPRPAAPERSGRDDKSGVSEGEATRSGRDDKSGVLEGEATRFGRDDKSGVMEGEAKRWRRDDKSGVFGGEAKGCG